jgi:hypothetical protein
LKLLIDHNLPRRIARALHELFKPEHQIVWLSDKFPQDTPDSEWLGTLVAEGGWSVLTRDLYIRTKPNERAALDSARLIIFFLDGAWKSYGVEETSWRLIRLIPVMAQLTEIQEFGRIDLPINATSKLRAQRR